MLTDCVASASGVNLSRVDVSRLDGIIVDGFVIDYVASNKEYLEHICTIYNIECVESDGILSFMPKYDKDIIADIPSCDLLSISNNSVVEVRGHKGHSIPSLIECLYFDKTKLVLR